MTHSPIDTWIEAAAHGMLTVTRLLFFPHRQPVYAVYIGDHWEILTREELAQFMGGN